MADEKGKEKVTMMKLKVDLDCAKCYKKVKKVLCKFPQIRDEMFDEKSNIVIIKVVCCSPEKIIDKLCSKGGGSIQTIEIIDQPKPPPQMIKYKELEKPDKPAPKPVSSPVSAPNKPKALQAAPMIPQGQQPIAISSAPYYEGFRGGPSFTGYGMPQPQPYECYGRPVYESWGGGPPLNYRQCHLIRCDCLSENNPQSCSTM